MLGCGSLSQPSWDQAWPFIDGSVVTVALPVIQRELNATATDVQWIVEAYSLFLAALILVGGALGDHFGRRRIFATGIAIFILASIWCGLSPNVLQLILARAVQGIGGALLVPGSLAIISASTSSEQRGRAIGTWSGFTAITSVVGPVLGGVLVQYARLSLGLLSQCPIGSNCARRSVLACSREP
jgi:MFS family permease